MSYRIINTPEFQKEIKHLSAKYPSLRFDFADFLDNLSKNPFQGISIGNNCYKVRLAIRSKGKGKSGGARVITYIQITKEAIVLISIYDKSEKANINDKEIKERLKQYLS